MSEFTDTLRCHDDPRLYLEADILLCAAADNIDRVEAEIASLKQELQALREQKPVAWTTMPDSDDWTFVSGVEDPNVMLKGAWKPLYAAPVPASEWQSIETAPKDGTWILAINGKTNWTRQHVVHYSTRNGDEFPWVTSSAPMDFVSGLTHWTPLPPPPKDQP